MAFDVETTLETIETALVEMEPARFASVRIGHAPPKKVLDAGYTALLSMVSARVAETTLVSTIELHTVRIGIFRAQAEAGDRDDALMAYRIVPEVMDLFKADYSLGATVRAVDWGGQYGAAPEAEYDEEEIAEKPYWTAHLTLPLIVDPATVFAA